MPYSCHHYHLRLAGFMLCTIILQSACKEKQPAENSPRVNILFAIADDASFPHMSAYGTEWVHTPAFDYVAKQGLLFKNAYTPNAKCSPSRACILTGRNSWQLEEAVNHWAYFPEKFTTFMEVLDSNNYHVGHTAKGWMPGIATKNGKERLLTGQAYNTIKANPPTAQISDIDYARNFESFLKEKDPDQPFCFWYGSFEPHRRYEYGSSIRIGDKALDDITDIYNFWPQTDSVRTDLLDYAFELEYFDRHLGQMIDVLRERGELENTLIIVTADNGMPFPRIKGQSYEYSNHMPLAMMWQNGIVNPGRSISQYVSFIDLAPTILDLSGIPSEGDQMQPVQGKSLVPLLSNEPSVEQSPLREFVLIGKERHDVGRPDDQGYPIRGIVQDEFLFVINFEPARWPAGNPVTGYLNTDASPTKTQILNWNRAGINEDLWKQNFGRRPAEELYDLNNDRDCLVNLANDARFRSRKEKLKNTMLSALLDQGDLRVQGKGEIYESYPYANLKHQNFYRRFLREELNALDAGWVNPGDFEHRDPE